MPEVKRYGAPKVDRAPLPGVRRSVDAPREAFMPAAPIDITKAESVIGEIVTEERNRANQIALSDAESQLADTETELLYNPKTGLLNRRGKEAFNTPEEFNTAWQKRASEISKTLGSDEQRAAFDIAAKRRHSDANRIVQRHVSGELRDYDDQTTKSFITNERNTAIASYNDPERVMLSIARQIDAIAKFGERNGLPADRVSELTLAAASDTHLGVINRMLANDEDLNAKAYYDTHKKEVTGTDATTIEKALDEGSTRGESQRQADEIVRKYPSRGDALAEVAKIKDPKVRDMAEDRVNHFFNARKQIEHEMRDDLYMRSTNMIDAQPGAPARSIVPPHIWSKLTLEQRGALERRATGDDSDLPHDSRTYLSFVDLTPQQMGALSQADFETKYWSKFDKPHRERATTIWASARDAVHKKTAQNQRVVSMINLNTRILNTLKKNRLLDPNKKPSKYTDNDVILRSEFTDEAVRQLEEWSAANGDKRPDGQKMQEILDRMALSKVFVDQPWRTDVERVGFQVTEDERERAYVPIDKIPKEEQTRISDLIRGNRKKVTTDKIQRAYAAHKLNDRALFNSIINE